MSDIPRPGWLVVLADVARVLERVQPIGGGFDAKGFRGVQATLVLVPSARAAPNEPAIGELASEPFPPERGWESPGSLPPWPNSCRSVME